MNTHVDEGLLSRVDPRRLRVLQTIRVGSGPDALAFGAGAIWVANSLDATLSRVDPATDIVVQTIAVGNRPVAVTVGGGSVWVANGADRSLSRIDPVSGRLVATIPLDAEPSGLAIGAGAIWVSSASARSVSRIDPHASTVAGSVGVGAGSGPIAFGAGAVWVANAIDGTVSRIDPRRNAVVSTIPVGPAPNNVAAAASGVWVTHERSGALTHIDPGSDAVSTAVRVGSPPADLALRGDDGVWTGVRAPVASHRGGTLVLVNAAQRFDSLDPAFSQFIQPVELLGMTNDGLLTFRHSSGGDGAELVPDLADALPAESDGGTVYALRLRRGLRYSSGAPIRPADVRATFERLYKVGSAATVFYDAIRRTESCTRRRCDLSRGIVTDERASTVTFRLRRPDPDFAYELALPYDYVLPADTPAIRLDDRPPAATGPYRIARYRPGHDLLLVRNSRFREWSPAAQPDGYPTGSCGDSESPRGPRSPRSERAARTGPTPGVRCHEPSDETRNCASPASSTSTRAHKPTT